MARPPIPSRSQANSINRSEFGRLFYAGQFEQAAAWARQVLKKFPHDKRSIQDEGVCYIHLKQWAQARKNFEKLYAMGQNDANLLDGLAHACFMTDDLDAAKKYGTQSLRLKDQSVMSSATLSHGAPRLPRPVFNPATPERNVISFSLYGNSPKYCETAVVNAQRQAQTYPHWRCCFYIDASVPDHFAPRVQALGAQVVRMQGEQAKLPGTMWRFLAADDPAVDFALFRDADSIINPREAHAVQAWLDGDKYFHVMRDYGSHTELILAGLWGLCKHPDASPLPPLEPLMQAFILQQRHPTHADQHFLRANVWPYVRNSVLQHDSYYELLDAQPFPDGRAEESHHVGDDQAAGNFAGHTDAPDGTPIHWGFFDTSTNPATLVCHYTTPSRNKQFVVNIPKPYIQALRENRLEARLFEAAIT